MCAHTPMEYKDDKSPIHDTKIIFDDLNAKVGREHIFGPIIEQFSLQDNNTSNGIRLIDFAATRNILKASWLSPD